MLETFVICIAELPLSISTRMQVNDMIDHNLLKASEIGKDQKNIFVEEHIAANSTMSFFHHARKNKLNTFKSMSKFTTHSHYTHSYS